jgi:2,4-dihydroxyhept-2-ene-1,7-dioic acid aldolase
VISNVRPPQINKTFAKLRAGEVAIGTLSLLPEPSLPELVGAVGYDFFVIDTEHVANDGQTLVHSIRGAQAGGVTPIVRVRYVEEKLLLWTLDSGAQGIMIPMINDAATARRAVQLTHYPPYGEKTMCSASRTFGHGAYRRDLKPYFESSNREVMLIALLETPEAINNAAEIAAEDVDVFCIGRGDLSVKMGIPYGPGHPDVVAATERALRAVIDAGKVGSVVAYDVEDAKRWIDFGCRFIIYSQPEMILATHYLNSLEAIQAHLLDRREGAMVKV